MASEFVGILQSIQSKTLPINPEVLFGEVWDSQDKIFRGQESYFLDFKDHAPKQFSQGFGASIVRLALAMYNTYGGIVVFGVNDKSRCSSGQNIDLDIESFSDVVTQKTGHKIDFKSRKFTVCPDFHVSVLLVPQRGLVQPAKLIERLDTYDVGTFWFRDRHSVRELADDAIPLLYSSRNDVFEDKQSVSRTSVQRTLPPSPATMREFVGRKDILEALWQWLVFDGRPRLYLHGPGGSGKSTLAYEFSRQVSEKGNNIAFSEGQSLDYVIFISAKETELNIFNAKEQPFYLRRFDDAPS